MVVMRLLISQPIGESRFDHRLAIIVCRGTCVREFCDITPYDYDAYMIEELEPLPSAQMPDEGAIGVLRSNVVQVA